MKRVVYVSLTTKAEEQLFHNAICERGLRKTAKAIGVSAATLSRWTHCHGGMSEEKFERLMAYLRDTSRLTTPELT